MRYRLRTLLIVLALGPPIMFAFYWMIAWALYLWTIYSIPSGIKGLS